VPEIQYLAYLHNAEDQLRGEAATLQFFSNGQYRNPMVVRIAGYGYQKGFGGHFHNDNAVGVLRDVPGLVIASPRCPTTRPPCCAPAWPRRRSTARCAPSSSPSRSTTRGTCTPTATASRRRRTPRPSGGRTSTCRSGAAGRTATATDLTLVSFANGVT
jgi:2-oxoisovalerate dehydrogenase E1 component